MVMNDKDQSLADSIHSGFDRVGSQLHLFPSARELDQLLASAYTWTKGGPVSAGVVSSRGCLKTPMKDGAHEVYMHSPDPRVSSGDSHRVSWQPVIESILNCSALSGQTPEDNMDLRLANAERVGVPCASDPADDVSSLHSCEQSLSWDEVPLEFRLYDVLMDEGHPSWITTNPQSCWDDGLSLARLPAWKGTRIRSADHASRRVRFASQVVVQAWNAQQEVCWICPADELHARCRTLWHLDGQICDAKQCFETIHRWITDSLHCHGASDSSLSRDCSLCFQRGHPSTVLAPAIVASILGGLDASG